MEVIKLDRNRGSVDFGAGKRHGMYVVSRGVQGR